MSRSVTVKLRVPVEFGKDAAAIEELVLKPTARAFKEFSLPMKEDGTILFEPYKLASVGVRMAGLPNAVVDKLDVEDMVEIAQEVMTFFAPSQTTGNTA